MSVHVMTLSFSGDDLCAKIAPSPNAHVRDSTPNGSDPNFTIVPVAPRDVIGRQNSNGGPRGIAHVFSHCATNRTDDRGQPGDHRAPPSTRIQCNRICTLPITTSTYILLLFFFLYDFGFFFYILYIHRSHFFFFYFLPFTVRKLIIRYIIHIDA